MSEFKGTPGPWEIRTAGNGDRGIIAPGTGIFIESFVEIRHSGEGAYDECKANARLIAASPDLMEALIAVRDRFFPANQSERDQDEMWPMVNDAIAKALGETK